MGDRIDLRVMTGGGDSYHDVSNCEFANDKLRPGIFTTDHLKVLRESKVILVDMTNQKFMKAKDARRYYLQLIIHLLLIQNFHLQRQDFFSLYSATWVLGKLLDLSDPLMSILPTHFFHVSDRHTGNHIATYEADPCFSFHSVNAWDGELKLPGRKIKSIIYMDNCMYDNADIVESSFNLGNQPKGTVASIRKRWRYSPTWLGSSPFSFTEFNKRRVASYTTIGYDLEILCINQMYNLRSYRYCWGIYNSSFRSKSSSGNIINGLIKLDFHNPYSGINTDKKKLCQDLESTWLLMLCANFCPKP
ncbi:hypothetical protein K501DRAFT_272062 [Backusella circina FSU 941]|nr:hypothetical protein K501DRAFT_272062 [Backusella circina FSU 941]